MARTLGKIVTMWNRLEANKSEADCVFFFNLDCQRHHELKKKKKIIKMAYYSTMKRNGLLISAIMEQSGDMN